MSGDVAVFLIAMGSVLVIGVWFGRAIEKSKHSLRDTTTVWGRGVDVADAADMLETGGDESYSLPALFGDELPDRSRSPLFDEDGWLR